MVKVFSVSQFKLSVYFIKFDDQKWDAVRVFPGFAILVFINELNPLSLRDAAIFEIFLNFLESLLLKNFSIFEVLTLYLVASRVLSGLQIFPPNVASQILVVFEI